MSKAWRLTIFMIAVFNGSIARAQQFPSIPQSSPSGGTLMSLDSLRARDDAAFDTIIYTSKYIRYSTLRLLNDATRTVPIDTSFRNFENYSPLSQPVRPTISIGGNGLAHRPLLFSPEKRIGFDPGFHSLDLYRWTQDSVRFYRARTALTDLYYVNGREQEQTLKILHTQNITPRLNAGANFNKFGGSGFYPNQRFDHLNAVLFVWYESANKRYNILGDALFTNLKSGENGSTTNDTIFHEAGARKDAQIVRLSGQGADRPMQNFRTTQFLLRQSYFVGRIDSVGGADSSLTIAPTQRLSHTLTYSRSRFKFFKNEEDIYGAFPVLPSSSFVLTNDSTMLSDLQNEFSYSFYLRGKAVRFIRNELKLDLGVKNNLYRYTHPGISQSFQNTTLKAGLAYDFNNRAALNVNLNQIAAGRNIGDFLYEAEANLLLSRLAGRVVLSAYSQNSSPQAIFERVNYQYHSWNRNFDRLKVNNLAFAYVNPSLLLQAKAEYFLTNNYLYFRETANPKQIEPVQSSNNINLLRLTLRKTLQFGRFNLDNFIAYQKSDFQDILRTPDLYIYNSFWFASRLFRVLDLNIGFDSRFNTTYKAPAYAINVSQFYNDNAPLEYSSYPVVDVWAKAALKRANLFVKYEYANQGLVSHGFYTVRGYPMYDRLLKFGVNWKFYD